MKKVFEFIVDNWQYITPAIYEVGARVIPTKRNLSLLDLVVKIISAVIANRRKKQPDDVIVSNDVLNPGVEKNIVEVPVNKHIIVTLLFFLSFTAIAQNNLTGKSFRSYNADSTTIKTETIGLQLFYGDVGSMYYNIQSHKWRVFQDSVWYDLLGGSGGGGSVTASNGLNAVGSDVRLGGTVTTPTTINLNNTLNLAGTQIVGDPLFSSLIRSGSGFADGFSKISSYGLGTSLYSADSLENTFSYISVDDANQQPTISMGSEDDNVNKFSDINYTIDHIKHTVSDPNFNTVNTVVPRGVWAKSNNDTLYSIKDLSIGTTKQFISNFSYVSNKGGLRLVRSELPSGSNSSQLGMGTTEGNLDANLSSSQFRIASSGSYLDIDRHGMVWHNGTPESLYTNGTVLFQSDSWPIIIQTSGSLNGEGITSPDITVKSGNIGSGTNSGNINLLTGTTIDGNTGNVSISTGLSSGTGFRGSVDITGADMFLTATDGVNNSSATFSGNGNAQFIQAGQFSVNAELGVSFTTFGEGSFFAEGELTINSGGGLHLMSSVPVTIDGSDVVTNATSGDVIQSATNGSTTSSMTLNDTGSISLTGSDSFTLTAGTTVGIEGSGTVSISTPDALGLNGDSGINIQSADQIEINGSFIVIPTLPTSCTGAPSGALWNDTGVLKICP